MSGSPIVYNTLISMLKTLEYYDSPQFEEDLDKGLLEIHERYGELMFAMIQATCPYVSGTLHDSFYLTVSADGVSIDSDCPYYSKIESIYQMVANAYAFYEPLMLAEIDALIASKETLECL